MIWEKRSAPGNPLSMASDRIPDLPWQYGSVHVSEQNGYLEIRIPFALKHLAREMGARRFDLETKSWILPVEEFPRVVQVTQAFFGIIPDESDVVQGEVPRIEEDVAKRASDFADFLAARYVMSPNTASAVSAFATLRAALEVWRNAFKKLPVGEEVAAKVGTLTDEMLKALPDGSQNPGTDELSSMSDLKAEQTILGALLIDNQVIRGLGWLRSEYFVDPINGQLFGMIIRRINHEQLADVVTLRPAIEQSGLLDEIGGPTYLAKLLSAVSDRQSLRDQTRDCAARVRDHHSTREVYAACLSLRAAFGSSGFDGGAAKDL